VLGKRTSILLTKFGLDAWKNFKLHENWSGLILNLMWETAMGADSKWYKYFSRSFSRPHFRTDTLFMVIEIVPKKFDTPIFWEDDDLAELKGTAVVGWFSTMFTL
jgi:SET domain-containing protein 6